VIVVGLTGGIASGKSTVSKIFERCGAVILDADQIARQIVAPGLPAWKEICEQFGDHLLNHDGTIDRLRLGELVFKEQRLRRQLEAIIHPRVRYHIDDQVRRLHRSRPEAVVVLDIPLLLETGMEKGLAEIIVVFASPAIQRQRLMLRDGYSAQEAQMRIDAQMSMDQKRRRATISIDNSGDRATTEKQTIAIYHQLALRAHNAG
jgi:dephospho-CoA kinase